MRIDAHQHFWHFDPVRDAWITGDMSVIRRDFLPGDLLPHLQEHGFDGCVTVQADQSETETRFLLENAKNHDFIKGVVGWVDLRAHDLEARLEQWADDKKLKGFRHILQAEKPEYMLSTEFVSGLRTIGKLGYTYDILVFPGHLNAVVQLLEQTEDQYFVIDHIAKPYIRTGEIEAWKRDIHLVAGFPNVYCKVSGLVTEASVTNWKPGDIEPYLAVVLEAFGTKRLMYGSDWPVCLLAASYERQLDIVESFFSRLSPGERERIMGLNAIDFYQLF